MVQCLVINTDSDITHRLFRRLRDVLISKAFRKGCRIKIAKGINCAQQHANISNEKPSLTKSVKSEKKSEGMSASEGGRSGGVFLHWGDGGM